ncbi:MAG: Hpt domain-containing protein [Acidiferrobacterales bacterium]
MSTDQDPIVSILLQEEPELGELVSRFIDALPGLVDDFASAIEQKDWPMVRQLAHDMKGIGGGYGYPLLSELAERMGQGVKNEQFVKLKSDLVEMKQLMQRIILGCQT